MFFSLQWRAVFFVSEMERSCCWNEQLNWIELKCSAVKCGAGIDSQVDRISSTLIFKVKVHTYLSYSVAEHMRTQRLNTNTTSEPQTATVTFRKVNMSADLG